MKPKLLLSILLISIIITSFLGCGDTNPIILEQAINKAIVHQSSYTGGLTPVGTVKDFGIRLDDPVAIEWNGEHLYMLANHGRFPNEAQYLFIVDRDTGIATFVNRAARNLGSNRSTKYLSPNDMTWKAFPEHYVQGIDYPLDYNFRGEMLASCPVLDSILHIHLDTGIAYRINWETDFCLSDKNGNPRYGAPRGLAYDGDRLFIGAFSRTATSDAQLLSLSTGNLRCAKPLTKDEIPFNVRETKPYALCFNEQFLYMSGADTNALYIIDRQTGKAHFIAKWYFTEMPNGFQIHPIGKIWDIEKDAIGHIDITGLAFDGVDMFAVDSFSDALYKLERN